MVDRYKLRHFTAERLAEVSSRWTDIAGQEEFEVELGTFFDWCGAHLEHKEGDGYALELYSLSPNSSTSKKPTWVIAARRRSRSAIGSTSRRRGTTRR